MNPLEEEIERIREVRRRISAQCGDDPSRLVEYYRQVSAGLRATGKYKFAESAPNPAEPTKGMLLREEPPPSH
jgi:hypothetical protein